MGALWSTTGRAPVPASGLRGANLQFESRFQVIGRPQALPLRFPAPPRHKKSVPCSEIAGAAHIYKDTRTNPRSQGTKINEHGVQAKRWHATHHKGTRTSYREDVSFVRLFHTPPLARSTARPQASDTG